jgi:aquaporin Z
MSTIKSDWKLFLAETIGTGLLLFFGLSIVIFNWGEGSVVADLIPSEPVRRLLTGFTFGIVGCLVTISPVGKYSGAHINPAVTLAFWLRGKMAFGTMTGYIIAQLIGGVLGTLPLLLWGKQGESVQYGITLPGEAGARSAFIGEVIVTACLIIYLYIFIGTKRLRNFTPYGIPILYAILSWLEAPISGCSTNPARSFAPALVAENFRDHWIYWVAPIIGMVIVTLFFRWRRINRVYKMEAARVSYHDHPTPESLKKGS